MCTRFTHLYACYHYTQSTITCASSRTLYGKCQVYKEKELEHEYDCDDCEEEAQAEEEEKKEAEESKKAEEAKEKQ